MQLHVEVADTDYVRSSVGVLLLELTSVVTRGSESKSFKPKLFRLSRPSAFVDGNFYLGVGDDQVDLKGPCFAVGSKVGSRCDLSSCICVHSLFESAPCSCRPVDGKGILIGIRPGGLVGLLECQQSGIDNVNELEVDVQIVRGQVQGQLLHKNVVAGGDYVLAVQIIIISLLYVLGSLVVEGVVVEKVGGQLGATGSAAALYGCCIGHVSRTAKDDP